jgi:hypothetical protein
VGEHHRERRGPALDGLELEDGRRADAAPAGLRDVELERRH